MINDLIFAGVLTLKEPSGSHISVPCHCIKLVDMRRISPQCIMVRVYHDAACYNPLIFYRGEDSQEAERIYTEILDFISNGEGKDG